VLHRPISLLLAVAGVRAEKVTQARVTRRWREDRLVRPSPHEARTIARIEAQLWDLLPNAFVGCRQLSLWGRARRWPPSARTASSALSAAARW
jgi:hypothetical protein